MGDRKQALLAHKDEHIGHLESQLHDSKSKLHAAQQSEQLVEQLIAAGVLVQQDDGTFRVERDNDK